MPFMESECVETIASSTDPVVATTTCSYTQVVPFAVGDWFVVLGLSFIVMFMAASFIRNVFYR